MSNPRDDTIREFQKSFTEMDGRLLAWGGLILMLLERHCTGTKERAELIELVRTMSVDIATFAPEFTEHYQRGFQAVVDNVVLHLERLR